MESLRRLLDAGGVSLTPVGRWWGLADGSGGFSGWFTFVSEAHGLQYTASTSNCRHGPAGMGQRHLDLHMLLEHVALDCAGWARVDAADCFSLFIAMLVGPLKRQRFQIQWIV